jgi:hypothetical protein
LIRRRDVVAHAHVQNRGPSQRIPQIRAAESLARAARLLRRVSRDGPSQRDRDKPCSTPSSKLSPSRSGFLARLASAEDCNEF